MRYKTLDSWRGICALLVVLFHAQGTGPLGRSAFVHGAFLFVDFFFVLSGFVMAEAYGTRIESGAGYRDFIVRRFFRVWPLHAAMLLAFGLLEFGKLGLLRVAGLQLSSAPFTGAMSPDGFLPSLFLVHAMGILPALTWNGPSWSIGAEFWTYAVFGLVAWRLRQHRVAAAAVIALGAAVVVSTRSTRLMDVSYDLGFVRCLYGFFVGVLTHRVSASWRATRAPFGTAIEAVSMGLGFAFVALAYDTRLAFLSPLVFGAIIFAFAWSDGGVSRVLRTAPFEKLGLWSYSIYMTHLFLLSIASMGMKVVNRLVEARHASEQWRRLVELPGIADASMLVFALLVVAVSSVTYRLIEVPAQQAGARWSKRRT